MLKPIKCYIISNAFIIDLDPNMSILFIERFNFSEVKLFRVYKLFPIPEQLSTPIYLFLYNYKNC